MATTEHRRGGSIGRVAMISLHTSPLDQPGTGDAGGMNVYVTEVAKQLAGRGIEVDVFTRATRSELPPTVELVPGVTVRHVVAGPFEGLSKGELPGQLCVFAREVLRTEAGFDPGHYDVVHSHYWLSGQVGALARDRWGVPLVHSMHTMAKVKNALLAEGDAPEPPARVIGEEQVVAAADVLVANTDDEAKELIRYYDAEPARVEVVHPGVDLTAFRPDDRAAVRRELGIAVDAELILFVGRLQPLKAPDIAVRALARIVDRHPGRRERLRLVVIGGASGAGSDGASGLGRLAGRLGVEDLVTFHDAMPREQLSRWYAASSVTCVPSYNESFGLVALESQACGTPVVAAAVGGLPTAVADGRSGLLVEGHDDCDYADAITRVLDEPGLSDRLRAGAVEHAGEFGWPRAADELLAVYGRAQEMMDR